MKEKWVLFLKVIYPLCLDIAKGKRILGFTGFSEMMQRENNRESIVTKIGTCLMKRFAHPPATIDSLKAEMLASSISPQQFFTFYLELVLKVCDDNCLHRARSKMVTPGRKMESM